MAENQNTPTPTGTPAPAANADATPVDTGIKTDPPAEGGQAAPNPITLDEPKVEVDTPPGEVEAVEYEPTGNAALDVTLSFLGNLGLKADDPVMVAAGNGDYSALENKLKGMGDKAKGWERYVAAGKEAYNKVAADRQEAANKNREVIEKAAGGADVWKEVQAWASAKADPDEKTSINAALTAGGVAAKAMAAYLANLYKGSPEYTKTGKDARGNAPANTNGAQKLTLQEYTKELQVLRVKLGFNMEKSQEYRDLNARRAASR